jgi:hypothetical protein
MADQEIQLTVLHRGVPVGVATVTLGPGADDPRLRPPRVFAATLRPALAAAIEALAPASEAPLPVASTFRPLGGYAAVRPVVRRAGEAFEHLGYLGPPSEAASAARGEAALAAAEELWAELELRDERGLRAAGRVIWLLELHPGSAPYQWVVISFEGAPAPVPAWPQPRRGGASDAELPAV